MNEPGPEPLAICDGNRYYTIASLAALFGTVVVLAARGLGVWSFVPALVGCVAVAARLRGGFFLFMLALLWIVVADKVGVTPGELLDYLVTTFGSLISTRRLYALPRGYRVPQLELAQPVLDILLCVAVVAFAAAYLRLLALTRNVFPVDRRRQRIRTDVTQPVRFMRMPQAEEKRSPGLVERIEMAPLLLAVAGVAMLAEVFWVWLSERDSLSDLSFTIQVADDAGRTGTQFVPIRIPRGIWQMLLVLWVFFLTIVPISAVLSWLGMRRATVAEAMLFLQDCVWRETRREQARSARWLAWAEQKYGRKQAARELKQARRSRSEK